MRTDRIKLEGSDDSTSRMERLNRVVGFIAGASGKMHHLEANMFKLEDHKGTLIVTWVRPPSDAAKNIVKSAWSNEDENEEDIRHQVLDLSSAEVLEL
jgi:hypothetical protein